MKMLEWNCRGAAGRGFVNLIHDIKKEYEVSMMFLVETHTKADRIVNRLGFDNWFVEEANGQARGIWILWNSDDWRVEILRHDTQFIHMEVSWRGARPWLLTVEYGSPPYQARNGLWDFLKEVSNDIEVPWAVVGDFNSLMHVHERNKQPTRSAMMSMTTFKKTVQECDLIDAGFQGYPYTWHHGDLEERLDRLLINI